MIEEYYDKLKKQREKNEALEKKYGQLSFFRLAVFVLAVVLFAIGSQNGSIAFILFGIASVFLFLYLVGYHARINDQLLFGRANYLVIEKYIKRIDGTWREFKEDGSEYADSKDHISQDIDLLGRASLYQFLCAAHTEEGKKLFAETVSLKNVDFEKIEEKNCAVTELGSMKDFAISFEGYSLNASEKKKKKRPEYIDTAGRRVPFYVKALMVLVPIVNIVLLVLFLLDYCSIGLLGLSFVFSLAVTFFSSGVTGKVMYPFLAYMDKSEDYYNMLKLFAENDYTSSVLLDIKEKLCSDTGSLTGFKSLKRKGEFFNLTNNAIVHFLLNGFLGWDFMLTVIAASWSKKYEEGFLLGLSYVARIEELISLSVLDNVRAVSKPEILREGMVDICTEDIVHPLLDVNKAVSNTVTFTDNTVIVTGSNMSGKTTFLRTLAINLALSYMGANVTASRFSAGYMRLFSSMRVNDDVANGISTFYAEILRIKEMSEYLKNEDNKIPAICFIDEIFKGTNSSDRIVGAKKAIRKLSDMKCKVFVSTHDFELCQMKLKDDTEVRNYHFEEHYEDDKLLFDYKIKDGVCTTRNALHILKMAGLSDD